MLWPSGPLSSDCHSWGLRDRFLQDSHSSKLTPPTKHCLPRPTSHRAICPDRWKDRGFETNLYLLPLIRPFFFFLPWLTHQSFSPSLTHFVFLSSLSCPTIFFFLVSFFITLLFRERVCLSYAPSPNSSTLRPGVHIHLFGSLPPQRE